MASEEATATSGSASTQRRKLPPLILEVGCKIEVRTGGNDGDPVADIDPSEMSEEDAAELQQQIMDEVKNSQAWQDACDALCLGVFEFRKIYPTAKAKLIPICRVTDEVEI